MQLERYAAIYTLADPRNGEVRYVGKAFDVKARFSAHLADRRKSHKTSWINSLASMGLKPQIETIEEFQNVTRETWEEAERFWIQTLKFYGFSLTNLTNGGVSGCRHAAETIARMSKAKSGRKFTDEHRRKLSQRIVSTETRLKIANAARNISEETRQKYRDSHRGKTASEETLRRMSLAHRGIRHTPEAIEKMRLAQKRHGPEHGLKISLAKKGKPLTAAHRAALRVPKRKANT